MIRSIGIAAGLILVAATASYASIPSSGDEDGLQLKQESMIAATPGDIVGDPILVARRGADDSPGHDHGKHHDHHQRKGHDDGPGHT
jgi:hypothetical protein